MKVVAALQKNENLAFHFGNADFYRIYEIVDGNAEKVKDIPHVLKEHFELYDQWVIEGVGLAVSGAIGETQIEHLEGRNIDVIYGLNGNPLTHIYAYLDGKISLSKDEDEPVAMCSLGGAIDLSNKE